MSDPERFWEHKTLEQLDQTQWEALCDGCAQCCLIKLEDEDSGQIATTSLCCNLLDIDSCRCTDYANRRVRIPDCVELNASTTRQFNWLPESCAYRRVAQGLPLPDWHYLISGDRDAVHAAQASIRDFAIPESHVHEDEWEECVIRWV